MFGAFRKVLASSAWLGLTSALFVIGLETLSAQSRRGPRGRTRSQAQYVPRASGPDAGTRVSVYAAAMASDHWSTGDFYVRAGGAGDTPELHYDSFCVGYWATPARLYSAHVSRWVSWDPTYGGGQVFWIGDNPDTTHAFGVAQSLSGAGGLGREWSTSIANQPWNCASPLGYNFYLSCYVSGSGGGAAEVNMWLDGVADNGAIIGTIPTALTGGDSRLDIGQTLFCGYIDDVAILSWSAPAGADLTAAQALDWYCAMGGEGASASDPCYGWTGNLTNVFIDLVPDAYLYYPFENNPNDLGPGARHLTPISGPGYTTTVP